MNKCPKCKRFYSSSVVDFCFDDGTPLVEVFDANSIDEGRRWLKSESRILRRRQWIGFTRKAFGFLISTAIVSSVIFVVIANVVIYLKPQADKASNVPSRDELSDKKDGIVQDMVIPEIEMVISTPSPTPKTHEQAIANSEPARTKNPKRKPTPIPTQKASGNEKVVSTPRIDNPIYKTPTPTPKVVQTPSITAVKTPVDLCSASNKAKARAEIIAGIRNRWQSKARSELKKLLPKNSRKADSVSDVRFQGVPKPVVSFGAGCKSASVKINYDLVINRNGKRKTFPRFDSYNCDKPKTWICR